MYVISHNVLTKVYVEKLFTSPELSRNTPSSFQCRIIFGIEPVTAMRPTELHKLKISQFSQVFEEGEEVWCIKGRMGAVHGTSNTSIGGWKSAKFKPKEAFVFNEEYFNGTVNIFQDVTDYLFLRKNLKMKKDQDDDRLFTAYNPQRDQLSDFSKCQVLGVHTLIKAIQYACMKNEIVGLGSNKGIFTHSLRGTVSYMLIEAGHTDSAVACRTGHKQLESLKNYQNLRGGEGRNQQNCIFASGKESTVTYGKEGMNDEINSVINDNGKRVSADPDAPKLEQIELDKPTSYNPLEISADKPESKADCQNTTSTDDSIYGLFSNLSSSTIGTINITINNNGKDRQ